MRDSNLWLASEDKHSTEYHRRTSRFIGPEHALARRGQSPRRWAAPFKRLIVRPALISSTTIVALLLITTTTTVDAQQPPNIRRVGVFPVGSSSGSDQFQALVKAFRDGLRDLNWIEGQNVVLEIRWGEGRIGDFQGSPRNSSRSPAGR